MADNLGNVVALIASTSEPIKKYIFWFHILNPAYPTEGVLKRWDYPLNTWVPVDGAFWLGAVIDYNQTVPPVSPAIGDAYIIAAAGSSGAWAGKANQHAVWIGHSWVFTPARKGAKCSKNSDSSITYFFDASTWSVIPSGGGGTIYTGQNGVGVSGSVIRWGTTPLNQVTQLNLNSSGGGYLQFIDGSDIIADFTDRKLYNSDDNYILDWEVGVLFNPITQEDEIDLETGNLWAENGANDDSVNFYERQLFSTPASLSINYGAREAYGPDGTVSIYYGEWLLRYQNQTIVDWSLAHYNDEDGNPMFRTYSAYDSDGNITSDFDNGILKASAGDTVFDWENGVLYGVGSGNTFNLPSMVIVTGGVNSGDFGNRTLHNDSGLTTVNFNQGFLRDPTAGINTIEWIDKVFYEDWSITGDLEFVQDMSIIGRSALGTRFKLVFLEDGSIQGNPL